MLVNTKAKVGVFSIALGAYLPQFPSLVPEFEAQYDAFKKTIPDTVEIVDGGMVTTKEQAMVAGDKFRAADVDLVFLQMLTYATSYNMLPAIRDLDVPVVLVNVQKIKALDYEHTDIASWLGEGYACGAVGEAVADLERAGKRHAVITGVVEGGDPAVQAEIEDWCKAAQVRRRFRETNIAQIGRPYPGMMDLYIDETNLYNRMFLYTKQFDWEKMWAIADDITDEDAIRAKAQDILDTFEIEGGGTIEKVWDMAKYVVAFLSGGIAVLVPLIFNLMCSLVLLPNLAPLSTMGENILTPLMLFYKIFFTHPMIYTMFFLVLQFLMAGIWACVCLSVSFLSDYKIVVLIFPFFVQLILHVICTITNHIDYSSVYWVQPGHGIVAWWIPVVSMGIGIPVTFFVFMKKGAKEDVF